LDEQPRAEPDFEISVILSEAKRFCGILIESSVAQGHASGQDLAVETGGLGNLGRTRYILVGDFVIHQDSLPFFCPKHSKGSLKAAGKHLLPWSDQDCAWSCISHLINGLGGGVDRFRDATDLLRRDALPEETRHHGAPQIVESLHHFRRPAAP